jgi:hypothetical protein
MSKGLKQYSSKIKIISPIDKMGRCDRCRKENQLIHQNVWLAPKLIYICPNCTHDWSKIYKNIQSKGTIEAFEDFIYKYKESFIFR